MTNQTSPANDLNLFAEQGGLRLVQWFSAAFLVGGLLLIRISFLNAGFTPLYLGLFVICLGIVVLLLVWKGKRQIAVITMIWSLNAMAILVAFNYSGIHAPILTLSPLVCMACAWLLGPKQGIACCLVNLSVFISLFIMHQEGHLFTTPILHNYLMIYIFGVVLGTVLGILSISSFRTQYLKAVNLSSALQEQVIKLQQSEESLEQGVQERTQELQFALGQLKQTQQELVKSETLASLGSMVAGVSHELNTPIGNAVTVASTLRHRFEAFEAEIQSGAIKRSALTDHAQQGLQMISLIERSVQRASELVVSFKQVAVDQTSERRREFDLHDLVEDIIATLRPGMKQKPWIITTDVPSGIACDSFPGPLGQIISNLIQNATIHAFEGRSSGNINIRALADEQYLQLEVEDDGNGMDEQTLAHAFDPFFTTRMGRGGSGLGLSICHRLSTSVLGGTLQAKSAPGQGVTCTLRIPRSAPGRI